MVAAALAPVGTRSSGRAVAVVRCASATAGGGKYLHWFENEVLDADGQLVARVRKQVYVRRKPDRRPAQGASAEG